MADQNCPPCTTEAVAATGQGESADCSQNQNVGKTCGVDSKLEKQTSCTNVCEYSLTPLDLPIKAETRNITLGHDECDDDCPSASKVYTCTKTSTKTQSFTKNNCPSYAVGSLVAYTATATATATSSVSDADACAKATALADNKALADIAAHGQDNANGVGTCNGTAPPSPAAQCNSKASATIGDGVVA